MNAPLNGAIYKSAPCGCKVVGDGTLPSPLTVQFCEKHKSGAYGLIDAILEHRTLLRNVVRAGRGLLASMAEEESLGHLADHTEGWDRAVKKLEAEVELAAAEIGS